MKILGKSDNTGMVIVQISKNELANFMGFYDFYAASKQPGMLQGSKRNHRDAPKCE